VKPLAVQPLVDPSIAMDTVLISWPKKGERSVTQYAFGTTLRARNGMDVTFAESTVCGATV
jgi:hypothetical protein